MGRTTPTPGLIMERKEYRVEQFKEDGYIRLDVRNHDFIRIYKEGGSVLIDFDEQDTEQTTPQESV